MTVPGSNGPMSATSYKLILHREALKEIRSLPKAIRTRVSSILNTLEIDPRPPQAERLKGRRNAYRIRVERYRLLYEVHAAEIVVYVIGVAHRKQAYIRLLRRT